MVGVVAPLAGAHTDAPESSHHAVIGIFDVLVRSFAPIRVGAMACLVRVGSTGEADEASHHPDTDHPGAGLQDIDQQRPSTKPKDAHMEQGII
ncbi:MAG: hypothetical protein M3Z08_10830 [Chloroflexota bacterium]|nr:hypothetical protein [Chloroflexota bacterium]